MVRTMRSGTHGGRRLKLPLWTSAGHPVGSDCLSALQAQLNVVNASVGKRAGAVGGEPYSARD